jgi:hypothetical protein
VEDGNTEHGFIDGNFGREKRGMKRSLREEDYLNM